MKSLLWKQKRKMSRTDQPEELSLNKESLNKERNCSLNIGLFEAAWKCN